MNMLYEEKRFPNVNEVCVVDLAAIKGNTLVFEDEYPETEVPRFFAKHIGLEDNRTITIVKYKGKGIFEELLTGEKLLANLFYGEEIGTEAFNELDLNSQVELDLIGDKYASIVNPTTYEQFLNNYKLCTMCPLVLSITNANFRSLNKELLDRYMNQPLDMIKSRMEKRKDHVLECLNDDFEKNTKKAKSYYDWLEDIKRR